MLPFTLNKALTAPPQVCGLLETLRGAALATLPSTQSALFSLYSELLPALLQLHSAFKHHAQVVTLLLKLIDAVIEGHVSYLDPAQLSALLGWTLQLLTQYSKSNLWQVGDALECLGLTCSLCCMSVVGMVYSRITLRQLFQRSCKQQFWA